MNMLDTVFEKVVQGRKGGEGEWGEVLKVLSGGKVRLMRRNAEYPLHAVQRVLI